LNVWSLAVLRPDAIALFMMMTQSAHDTPAGRAVIPTATPWVYPNFSPDNRNVDETAFLRLKEEVTSH
jgi:hypothetical protein